MGGDPRPAVNDEAPGLNTAAEDPEDDHRGKQMILQPSVLSGHISGNKQDPEQCARQSVGYRDRLYVHDELPDVVSKQISF